MTNSIANLTTDEKFFFYNAGFSYKPGIETAEEGKLRCAIDYSTSMHSLDFVRLVKIGGNVGVVSTHKSINRVS